MPGSTRPFALSPKLPGELAHLHRYWNDLKRGDNAIPFSDDVNPSALSELSNHLMLVDVFENPARFRFSTIGQSIATHLDVNLTGKFSDEVEPRPPLDYFNAQANATIEARAPTFHRGELVHKTAGYSRLILPTWGNGQIDMLVCAIV